MLYCTLPSNFPVPPSSSCHVEHWHPDTQSIVGYILHHLAFHYYYINKKCALLIGNGENHYMIFNRISNIQNGSQSHTEYCPGWGYHPHLCWSVGTSTHQTGTLTFIVPFMVGQFWSFTMHGRCHGFNVYPVTRSLAFMLGNIILISSIFFSTGWSGFCLANFDIIGIITLQKLPLLNLSDHKKISLFMTISFSAYNSNNYLFYRSCSI